MKKNESRKRSLAKQAKVEMNPLTTQAAIKDFQEFAQRQGFDPDGELLEDLKNEDKTIIRKKCGIMSCSAENSLWKRARVLDPEETSFVVIGMTFGLDDSVKLEIVAVEGELLDLVREYIKIENEHALVEIPARVIAALNRKYLNDGDNEDNDKLYAAIQGDPSQLSFYV